MAELNGFQMLHLGAIGVAALALLGRLLGAGADAARLGSKADVLLATKLAGGASDMTATAAHALLEVDTFLRAPGRLTGLGADVRRVEGMYLDDAVALLDATGTAIELADLALEVMEPGELEDEALTAAVGYALTGLPIGDATYQSVVDGRSHQRTCRASKPTDGVQPLDCVEIVRKDGETLAAARYTAVRTIGPTRACMWMRSLEAFSATPALPAQQRDGVLDHFRPARFNEAPCVPREPTHGRWTSDPAQEYEVRTPFTKRRYVRTPWGTRAWANVGHADLAHEARAFEALREPSLDWRVKLDPTALYGDEKRVPLGFEGLWVREGAVSLASSCLVDVPTGVAQPLTCYDRIEENGETLAHVHWTGWRVARGPSLCTYIEASAVKVAPGQDDVHEDVLAYWNPQVRNASPCVEQ